MSLRNGAVPAVNPAREDITWNQLRVALRIRFTAGKIMAKRIPYEPRRQGLELRCVHCNKQFIYGEEIISRLINSRRGCHEAYYHLECAEALNIM